MNLYINAITVKLLIVFLATMAVSKICIMLSMKLLREADCTRVNYREMDVAFGVGIIFIPILLIMLTLSLLLFPIQYMFYTSYLLGVTTIGFAGLLDDLLGDKNTKGIRKHIGSFFKGKLTTGFIKAFVGFIVSFIISINISVSFIDFLLNIFNMAFFTNALNLMDLRPGRCVKVFLLIGLIIFLSNLHNPLVILPLGIMLIASAMYMKYDLRELCMLGDTGSNILGITLGYFSAVLFDGYTKFVISLTLLSLNIIAEKISISKVIAKNRILNYLDSLGRSSG